MTVSNTNFRNEYTGNGSTTVFPYIFRILKNTEIKVTVDSVVKTLTTDYTVSGVDVQAGGNVTFVTAPASAAKIVFTRNMAHTQEADYGENDSFPAETHEKALDRGVLETQQVQEQVDRSLKYAEGSQTTASRIVPDPTASKFLGWNSAGTALENKSGSTGAASDVPFTPTGNIAATNVQTAIAEVDGEKVAKAGDTMTGQLTLPGSGTGNQAATVNQVDAKVSKSGDTMTGFLTLNADPTSALHAATKQYAEKVKRSSADTTTGYISDKFVAGTNVTFTVLNAGANEQLQISASGGGGGAGLDELASIPAISLTALADTTLYTVPIGKKTAVSAIMVICDAATAITIAASVSAGANSAPFDDIMPNQSLGGLTVANKYYIFQPAGSTQRLLLASEVLKLKVNTAATGTSQSVTVKVFGREY